MTPIVAGLIVSPVRRLQKVESFTRSYIGRGSNSTACPFPLHMTSPTIDIQHVTKRFSGHTAVRDLSLQVPAGSVYGLLGPNGAGKTTTIRMILNIIAPDEGTIRLFGESSTGSHITNRIGYLPEER